MKGGGKKQERKTKSVPQENQGSEVPNENLVCTEGEDLMSIWQDCAILGSGEEWCQLSVLDFKENFLLYMGQPTIIF